MKNAKRPTREQKKLMAKYDLNVDSFLVVKNLPDRIEIVKASDLKKYKNDISKMRTRILFKHSIPSRLIVDNPTAQT